MRITFFIKLKSAIFSNFKFMRILHQIYYREVLKPLDCIKFPQVALRIVLCYRKAFTKEPITVKVRLIALLK